MGKCLHDPSRVWSEKWFRAFPPLLKLAYLNLLAHCDSVGIAVVDHEIFKIKSGLDFEFEELMIRLHGHAYAFDGDSKVFIPWYIKDVYGESKDTFAAKVNAIKQLDSLGFLPTLQEYLGIAHPRPSNNTGGSVVPASPDTNTSVAPVSHEGGATVVPVSGNTEASVPPSSTHTPPTLGQSPLHYIISNQIRSSSPEGGVGGVSQTDPDEFVVTPGRADECWDVWCESMVYLEVLEQGCVNHITPREQKSIGRSIQSNGITNTKLALEGVRYRSKSADFDPTKHLSVDRTLFGITKNGGDNFAENRNLARARKLAAAGGANDQELEAMDFMVDYPQLMIQIARLRQKFGKNTYPEFTVREIFDWAKSVNPETFEKMIDRVLDEKFAPSKTKMVNVYGEIRRENAKATPPVNCPYCGTTGMYSPPDANALAAPYACTCSNGSKLSGFKKWVGEQVPLPQFSREPQEIVYIDTKGILKGSLGE